MLSAFCVLMVLYIMQRAFFVYAFVCYVPNLLLMLTRVKLPQSVLTENLLKLQQYYKHILQKKQLFRI